MHEPPAYTFTEFYGTGAARKAQKSLTLPALKNAVLQTSRREKAALPWLKFATFGEILTEKKSFRHDANVIQVTGLEADYDGEVVHVAEAVEKLTKAGVLAFVYTSPSHSPDKPRWRVVCPFSQPYPPEKRAAFLGRLNGLLGGILAGESWTLSQSYFYGRVGNNPAHTAVIVEGEHIDQLDELDEIWLGKPNTGTAKVNGSGQMQSGPVDQVALLQEIEDGKSYHTAMMRLLGVWALNDGVPMVEAKRRILDAMDMTFPPDRDQRWNERRVDLDRCIHYVYGKQDAKTEADRSQDTAHQRLILSPGAPLDSGREFLRRQHTAQAQRTLHHQNSTFYTWEGSHYREYAGEELQARLYSFLDKAFVLKDDKLAPFNPNRSRVANVMEAVAAEAQIPTHNAAPMWLDGRTAPPPNELISCSNGLLHLTTKRVLPHTPALFAMNALPFAYDAGAPAPLQWLNFLNGLWYDDCESISTLQEMFGLLLTGETRHQKMFLVVGPKRSGKGTIARVLTHLLGQANVCGPTLGSISQNFGIAPLIGKRLAIISDARLSGKADQAVIVERLLAITGEDSLTVDRKFRDPWTGRLQTRFLVLTNEVPRLTDSSGALASRFVTLILRKSFYGQEDHGLTDKLLAEMPGILKWAIEGWERLVKRGHFVVPQSSSAVQQEMEDLGSPIGAFLRHRCKVQPGQWVACDDLYNSWLDWCRDQHREHVGTVQDFGRSLRAAVSGLAVTNNRLPNSTQRERRYEGIRLKTAAERDAEE